jgi:hypothetical protein
VQISLTLEKRDGREPLTFHYSRMVNAGYVGRNQEEVRRHVEELAKKGIPGPKATPTVYPVICRNLVTDSEIEVYGGETSGEVEYVLLVENDRKIYVGLGSDHTDRGLEEVSIPKSKQICPNIISRTVWLLSEVEEQWDDLEIQSVAVRNGEEIIYQQGRLELIMAPKQLLEFVHANVSSPLDGTVIFSGTIGILTDGFVYGERFLNQLTDPAVGRRLKLSYDVKPLKHLTGENV